MTKPYTRVEAYLAYKAGQITLEALKPGLANPRNGLEAWLAYWTGLVNTYPTKANGEPGYYTEEEAYIAYLCGVIDEYPVNCYHRMGAYLRYIISAHWGRPDHPLTRDEYYLSLIKPSVVPSSLTPLSHIILDGTTEGELQLFHICGDSYQSYYPAGNLAKVILPDVSFGGIDFTNNNDGSFSLQGTATENAQFRFNQSTRIGSDKLMSLVGQYTLSCANIESSEAKIYVMTLNTWNIKAVIDKDHPTATFTQEYTSTGSLPQMFMYVEVPSGKTVSGSVNLYPCLEWGAEATPYTRLNLFDYITPFNSGTYSGVTASLADDGTITVSGKPTTGNIYVVATRDIINELEDGATYTISADGNDTKLFLRVKAPTIATIDDHDPVDIKYYETKQGDVSFTVDKSTYRSYDIMVMIGSTSDWGASELTIKRKFKLEKGATSTPFCPYTGGEPAPNPSYPQAIQCVKGKQSIKLQGKNLFPYQNLLKQTAASINMSINTDGSVGFSVASGAPSANNTHLTTDLDITDRVEDGEFYILSKSDYTIGSMVFPEVRARKIADGTYTYYSARTGAARFKIDKSVYDEYKIWLIENNNAWDAGIAPNRISCSFMFEKIYSGGEFGTKGDNLISLDPLDWQQGYYDGSGLLVNSPSDAAVKYRICQKDRQKTDKHISLVLDLPNGLDAKIQIWDEQLNYIGNSFGWWSSTGANTKKTFSVPANTYYVLGIRDTGENSQINPGMISTYDISVKQALFPTEIEPSCGGGIWDKAENLFNPEDSIYGIINNAATTEELPTDSNRSITSGWMECEPNTNYVLRYNGEDDDMFSPLINRRRCRWQFKSDTGVITQPYYDNRITTANDTKYIRVYFANQYSTGVAFESPQAMTVQVVKNPFDPIEIDLNTLGSNLYDKNDDSEVFDGYINWQGKLVASNNDRCVFVPCEPNTTYTIKKAVPQSQAKLRVATSPVAPVSGGNTTVLTDDTYLTKGSATVTTPSDANFLIVFCWTSGGDATFDDIKDSIWIEKGTTVAVPLELYKLGDYYDYIYKDTTNGKWYKMTAIEKMVLAGYDSDDRRENWYVSGQCLKCNNLSAAAGGNQSLGFYQMSGEIYRYTNATMGMAYANYLRRFPARYIYDGEEGSFGLAAMDTGGGNSSIYVSKGSYTLETWKAHLQANPLEVYYVIANRHRVLITNEELISKLEYIRANGSLNGVTEIEITGDGTGLTALLRAEALKYD